MTCSIIFLNVWCVLFLGKCLEGENLLVGQYPVSVTEGLYCLLCGLVPPNDINGPKLCNVPAGLYPLMQDGRVAVVTIIVAIDLNPITMKPDLFVIE